MIRPRPSREEVSRVFSQFATRGAAATREKWSAYVNDLRGRITREKGVDLLADLVAQVERQITKARNRLLHLQSVMMTS